MDILNANRNLRAINYKSIKIKNRMITRLSMFKFLMIKKLSKRMLSNLRANLPPLCPLPKKMAAWQEARAKPIRSIPDYRRVGSM